MPINPYYLPQLTIRQNLEQTSSAAAPRMATLIVAPEYLLSRYGEEDAVDTAFASGGQTLAWQYVDDAGDAAALPANYTADVATAKLYAETLRCSLAAYTAANKKILLESLSTPNIIGIFEGFAATTGFAVDANELAVVGHTFSDGDKVRVCTTGSYSAPLTGGTDYYVVNSAAGVIELALTQGGTPITLTSDGTGQSVMLVSGSDALAGTSLATLFRGRDTAVGDYVRVDDGSTVRERRVVALVGATVASTYGSNSAADDSTAANGEFNPITDAVADTAVALLTPAGFTQTIDQASVTFNVAGSSVIDRKVAEEFTITVTQGGDPGPDAGDATFTITSKSGIYGATGVKATDSGGDYVIDDAELAGAELTISGGTVSTGQVFRFRCYQAYERLTHGTGFTISDTGSGYTGPSDTTYIIEVTTGSAGVPAADAKLKIYDTQNIEEIQENVAVTDSADIAVGTYGMQITFDLTSEAPAQTGLRAGDIYYVHVKAETESTTTFDKVVLDGPVINPATFTDIGTPLAASFHLKYTGEIEADAALSEVAWTAAVATGITVNAGLALYVAARDTDYEWVTFEDAVGTLALSFRALRGTTSSEGMGYVEVVDDIPDACGIIAIENDLGFGVSEGLRGANGNRVYFINTGGTTAAAYAAALAKVEATDIIYNLGIVCDDDAELRAAVEQHVLAMSAPERKMFRKAYFGISSPGDYVILNTQTGGTPYTCTITDYGGDNLLVTMTEAADGIDFDSITFVAGDTIRITSTGVEYPIASKLSSTELLLSAGPTTAVSPAVPFTVWKTDTATSQGDYIITAANALDNRRCTLVWYEDGMRTLNGSPTVIPPKYAAAEIAGLRSALPPQVGLTRVEVTAITSAPTMYNKYTTDDLNRIASEGVLIVTQSAESGAVFIRHQLTTEADNGLLYYEDNVSMIVDYLSFLFKDAFDELIGRVNVTEDTIADLFNRCVAILEAAKHADVTSIYGPLIIDYNGLTVERNDLLRDRIDISVNVSIPIPMNQLDITVNAYVDLPTISTATL